MQKHLGTTSLGTHLAQIAWVVSDIKATEKFFLEVIGVRNFVKMEHLRAEEIEGVYLGEKGNYAFHLYLAYSGDTLIELIQPISGQSIYQDYLNKHPEGGIQHIAYTVPDVEFDTSVSELEDKGYSVIQSLTLPVAKVAYFDTYKMIGVVTEIIGVNAAGVEFLNQLKSDAI